MSITCQEHQDKINTKKISTINVEGTSSDIVNEGQ